MNFIDDKGRLLGTINVIDALAVLLVLATVTAGTAFVLGERRQVQSEHNTTITVEVTDVEPYVADAIPEGSTQTDASPVIQNKSVRPTRVVVRDRNGTLHVREHPRRKSVTLRVSLETMKRGSDVLFRDESLEVGRRLALDFGPVTVNGTVTELPDGN